MTLSRCMFCFSQHACSLRFTKKGLPYLTCRICYSRAFFHGLDALRGAAICPDLIDEVLRQVADGKAPWVRQRTKELHAFVRDRMSGKGLPDADAAPVPYTDDEIAVVAHREEKIA